jgi:hypothetical protein
MGNTLPKIDIHATPIHPTTMTKDEILSYRNLIEALSVTPEPKPGEENYRKTLAMIIVIQEQMKDRVTAESDQMELSQIEYVARKASTETKQIRLQQMLNLLDKVLERLQPTE